ncbi:DUF4189 domain-containing protein [Porphyrobacter sp. CACIAM 03H1]|uniref:DUF4189 domain-containing protein n=1 Tax=Porphyrobacter sp. CACIAM 03H1 TaxID=2003315 RepID=UPI000B5A5806|nr:DUF4189 domain-containing protein [Porphyrobacter sp. CACIAM 03H1]ASJ91948.1 hypothetical protein CBR61_14120 [Porphyrobacter sp. CACIAM 03H1]
MSAAAAMNYRSVFRGLAVTLVSAAAFWGVFASGANPPAHFAVAVNPAFVGYFITSGEHSSASARKKVLQQCKRATGRDCEIIMASQGGFLALGYSPAGNLRLVVESTKERAAIAFDEDCNAEYGGTCALEQLLDLSSRRQISESGGPRRFAALAFGAKDVNGGQDGRVWLAAGRTTEADAVSTAMQRCAAAIGQADCRSYSTSGQTHIALYRSSDGRSGGMQINLSQQLVIAAVDRTCKQDGVRCEIVALAATQDLRDEEYDLYRMKGVPL